MHPSKVTQGPRKQEFPGGRPLLEAREAELGDKLFKKYSPGLQRVVHLKAEPSRIHTPHHRARWQYPHRLAPVLREGVPSSRPPQTPRVCAPPPAGPSASPRRSPSHPVPSRAASASHFPQLPPAPAPAPARRPVLPVPPDLTPGLFPGPAQPSLTPTPAPFRSQLGSVSPASPGPQPWRQAGGLPALLTEADEGEGAS